MAIELGNSSRTGDYGTAQNTMTWSHECAADTDILIICIQARETTAADRVVDGVTFNGLVCLKAHSNQADALDFGAEIWYRNSPTIGGGGYDIQVTFTGKVTEPSGSAHDFKNVDTATVPASTNQGSGNGQTGAASLPAPR